MEEEMEEEEEEEEEDEDLDLGSPGKGWTTKNVLAWKRGTHKHNIVPVIVKLSPAAPPLPPPHQRGRSSSLFSSPDGNDASERPPQDLARHHHAPGAKRLLAHHHICLCPWTCCICDEAPAGLRRAEARRARPRTLRGGAFGPRWAARRMQGGGKGRENS